MTIGFLAIAGYHGSDTYMFTGSNDPMAGSLQPTPRFQWKQASTMSPVGPMSVAMPW
jgi:hypothetical protein